MALDLPDLTYRLTPPRGRSLMDVVDGHAGVVGDIPLWDAHEVYVAVTDQGRLSINVEGRMLKRDGGAGPHRTCTVDLSQTQPDWLRDIIVDAFQRLPEATR